MNIVSQPKSLARKHFNVGYALYVHNQPLSACQHDWQRRGWLAANVAEAEAGVAGYASKMGW